MSVRASAELGLLQALREHGRAAEPRVQRRLLETARDGASLRDAAATTLSLSRTLASTASSTAGSIVAPQRRPRGPAAGDAAYAEEVRQVAALQHQPRDVQASSGFHRIEKKLLERRDRHDAALRAFDAEVTAISEAMEAEVLGASHAVKRGLEATDGRLEALLNELDDDAALVIKGSDEVENSRRGLADLCGARAAVVDGFEAALGAIEVRRAESAGAALRSLVGLLNDIAHRLPPSIERIGEELAFETNKVVVENRKSHAELLALLRRRDVAVAAEARARWEQRFRDWRRLRHERALEEYQTDLGAEAFTNPPARQALLEAFRASQGARHEKRLAVLGGLASTEASSLSPAAVQAAEASFAAIAADEQTAVEHCTAELGRLKDENAALAAERAERLRRELHGYAALHPAPEVQRCASDIEALCASGELDASFKGAASLRSDLGALCKQLRCPTALQHAAPLAQASECCALLLCGEGLDDALRAGHKASLRAAALELLDKLRRCGRAEISGLLPALQRRLRELLEADGLDALLAENLRACEEELGAVLAALDAAAACTQGPRRSAASDSDAPGPGTASRSRRGSAVRGGGLGLEEPGLDVPRARHVARRLAPLLRACDLPLALRSLLREACSMCEQQAECNRRVNAAVAGAGAALRAARAAEQEELARGVTVYLETQAGDLAAAQERICAHFLGVATAGEAFRDAERRTDEACLAGLWARTEDFRKAHREREDRVARCLDRVRHAADDAELRGSFDEVLRGLEDIERHYRAFHRDMLDSCAEHPLAAERNLRCYRKSVAEAMGLVAPKVTYQEEAQADLDRFRRGQRRELWRSEEAAWQTAERPRGAPEGQGATAEAPSPARDEEARPDAGPDGRGEGALALAVETSGAPEAWARVEEVVDICGAAYGVARRPEDLAKELLRPAAPEEPPVPPEDPAPPPPLAASAVPRKAQTPFYRAGYAAPKEDAAGAADPEALAALEAAAFLELSPEAQAALGAAPRAAYEAALSRVRAHRARRAGHRAALLAARAARLAAFKRARTLPQDAGGAPCCLSVSLGAADLPQVLRALRSSVLGQLEADAERRRSALQHLRAERQRALHEELEARLRRHWPRRGRAEVDCKQPRVAELLAHAHKAERHRRETLHRAAELDAAWRGRLRAAEEACAAFEAGLEALRGDLGGLTNLAALQAAERRGGRLCKAFEVEAATALSALRKGAEAAERALEQSNAAMLRSCVAFREGGDYAAEELAIVERQLAPLRDHGREQRQEHDAAAAALAARQGAALRGAAAFREAHGACLVKLSMRQGLGPVYGAPRRTAQERLRAELAKDGRSAAAVDALLDRIEALRDEIRGAAADLRPAPEDADGAPRSARMVELLVLARDLMEARGAYLCFLGAPEAWRRSPRALPRAPPGAAAPPLGGAGGEEGDLRVLRAPAGGALMPDSDLAALTALGHGTQGTLRGAVERIEDLCRRETRELYAAAGEEEAPQALQDWLAGARERVLGPGGAREAACRRLRQQAQRLERLLQKRPTPAPPGALGAPASALAEVLRRGLARSSGARRALEGRFRGRLEGWHQARGRHQAALKPALGAPERRAELRELAAAEGARAAEAMTAVGGFKWQLLGAEAAAARAFVLELGAVTRQLMAVLDATVYTEDLGALPGDGRAGGQRKGLRRLRKACRREEARRRFREGGGGGAGAGNGSGDAAWLENEGQEGRAYEGRTWPGLALAAALGPLVAMPEGAAEDVDAARVAPPWLEELQDGTRLRSFVTTAHRCLLRARDQAFADYVAHLSAVNLDVGRTCSALLAEERRWSDDWDAMVRSLEASWGDAAAA